MKTLPVQWSFRPATPEDLPELVKIEETSHPAPWSLQNFQAELEKPFSHVLVLTDDETDAIIAGYAVFWLINEECQILNLAVDTPFRRKGLGKLILQQIVRQAERHKMKQITLEVRKSNMPAIQLYQNNHFLTTHVRKEFYSNGEDAYHMVLNLTDDVMAELI